jgi:hypothetical protein
MLSVMILAKVLHTTPKDLAPSPASTAPNHLAPRHVTTTLGSLTPCQDSIAEGAPVRRQKAWRRGISTRCQTFWRRTADPTAVESMNDTYEPSVVVACLGARSFGVVYRNFAKIRTNFHKFKKKDKYNFTNSITRSSTQINKAISHI